MAELEYYAKIPQRTAFSKRLNGLSPTARWLYVILMAESHGIREQFPITYTELEEVTGFARTTIRRAIASLVKAGFISYEQGGLQNPNLYTMSRYWKQENQRSIKDLDEW